MSMLDALHFSPEKQPHSISGLRDAYTRALPAQGSVQSDQEKAHDAGSRVRLGWVIEAYTGILHQPFIERPGLLAHYRSVWQKILEDWRAHRAETPQDQGHIDTLALVLEHLKLVDDWH